MKKELQYQLQKLKQHQTEVLKQDRIYFYDYLRIVEKILKKKIAECDK